MADRKCLVIGAAGGIEDKLLAHCWANVAYCMIGLGEWQRAFPLLSDIFDMLKAVHAKVDPADVPGLVTWIKGDGVVMETMDPPTGEFLEAAIAECPDKSLINANLLQMTALLRQFSEGISAG